MANTIKLKRGSGSDPGTSDLSVGELAIRTDTALLFTKNDGGSVVPIGISDGDKGDITVSSNGGTFTIDNDAVTTAKIVDGAVTADKIASQTITADKIANDAVNTGELADGSVTAAKIATNVITADKIASGAVNTGELGADAVTGAKIADDSIDSEHYVDGSIDTAHIADDQVTYAKIQNVSATNRILGRDSSGAGVIEEITPANLRTMLNVEDGATADQSASEIVALIADQTIAPSIIDMEDNEKIKLGTGDDLELFHNGTDSHIDNNTGDLYLTTTGSGDDIHIRAVDDVKIKVQGNEDAISCQGNGSVDLYYDGSKKLETTSDGIKVTDLVTDGEVNIMGTSDGNKYIDARVGSDSLQIRATSGGDSNHETMAKFFGNGSVELYHDASKKFETSSSGATITGTCTATAFSGDGSSLTGISAGATGGGSDEIFYENGQNVTTDYTITNGKNAMSAGPITIDSGVTVTVGAGETLTIV